VLKSSSSVSKSEKVTAPDTDRASVRRRLPAVKKAVVSEVPDTPKLLVKPLLSPALTKAFCHTFVKRILDLLVISLPSLAEAMEIPPEVKRDSVGVSLILRLLKKSSPMSKL